MSNTQTKGKITINGVAIRGLTVIVYDQEYFLGMRIHSQKLKSTRTDSNGNYTVSYAANDYGGNVSDEDRVQTSPGSLWPPRLPTYAAANPDLYIEVYQGNTKLKTSDIKKDVTAGTCIINLNIEQDPQGERGLGETLGDLLIDGLNTIVNGGAGLVEQVGGIIGDGADSIFGEGSGDPIREGSSRFAGTVRNWGNKISNTWGDATNRTVPIPEDLWESMRDRYRNYKRDLLLRHFFIDRTNQHHLTERAIPFLVSSECLIGKIDIDRVPSCDGLGRYNAAEKYPLIPLTKTNENDDWSNEQWREHLRKNGDKYARKYENGLAYNGAFIACLAHEYALADAHDSLSSSTSPEDYKYECEALITLALDAIEDLQNRTEPGYIIRYHEDGDCSDYGRKMETKKEFPFNDIDNTNFSSEVISLSVNNKIQGLGYVTPDLRPQIKRRYRDVNSDVDSWVVYYNDLCVFMLVKNSNGNVTIAECEKRYCGLKNTENYCKTLSGNRPEDDDWLEEKRQRLYEPSGDEYINLVEGLVVAYNILPEGSENHDRIKSLISNIHTYLVEHYYFLIRPCGNFTVRGPYMSTYEFPLSCMFKDILGVEQSNTSRISIQEVLEKAQITNFRFDDNEILICNTPHDIHIQPSEECSFMIDINVLHKLPSKLRWIFVFDNLATVHVDPGAFIKNVYDYLGLKLNQKDREYIEDKIPTFSLLQVWTLEMLVKACLIGESGVSVLDNQKFFQDIFDDWFTTIGDSRVASMDYKGYSYNPITLATAVALLGKKTPLIWNKLNFFFHREHGITENTTNENGVEVNELRYPVDHLKLDLTFDNGAKGEERAGDHSLLHAMWPCATIAHSLGKPLNAAISDFVEEDGMLSNSDIRNLLDIAIANR